ncbi:MAG: hypothetical protein ACR2K1_13595, partial [Saprospiraceae bacterium]
MDSLKITPNVPSGLLPHSILRYILLILLVCTFDVAFAQVTKQFTTVGDNSFTPPAGVTTVDVQAWGGGGAGGGSTANTRQGGGGGGGAYRRTNGVTVNPLTTYTLTVGAGGTASTGNGGNGGASTATFGATTVSANGGAGGTGAAGGNGTGGAGGTGATFAGGAGRGGANNGARGGGGGSAGTAANGNDGSNTNTNGGAAVTGGGAGGNGGTNADGSPGLAPGGGGGGGEQTGGTARTGGAGARGQVYVIFTCPTYAYTGISATNLCLGGTSTVTLTGTTTGLPTGIYTVTYTLSGSNSSTGTASMTINTAGSGSFTIPSSSLSSSGSSMVTVTKLESGDCMTNIASGASATLTVATDPAAPTATKSPDVATVCVGASLTLTGVTDNGGGTGNCKIEYSLNGGAWTTTLSPITAATGSNTIAIRKNCDGSGCDISSVTTYTWTGVADPSAPTATKSPNVATVCVGASLTLTGVTDNGGGTGTCIIEYSANDGAWT